MKLLTRQEFELAGFIVNTVGLTVAAVQAELTYLILFGISLIAYTYVILLEGGKKKNDDLSRST